MAIVGSDVAPEKHREVIEELTKLEDVRQLATLAGEHMITLFPIYPNIVANKISILH